MSELTSADRSGGAGDDAGRGNGSKRPYEKPAFRHERVFETMALACGKISSTQLQCRTLLKSS